MPITGVGGVTVHSELTGLDVDDHSQYVMGDASRTSERISILNTTENIAISSVNTFDSNNADAGFFWDNSAGANTNLVILGQGGNDSRRTAYFARNLGSPNTGQPVVAMVNSNSGDDQKVLYILNNGTGGSLLITDTTASAGQAVEIDSKGTQNGIYVHRSNNSDNYAGYFRDMSDAGANNYVGICQGADAARKTLDVYRNRTSANANTPVCTITNASSGDTHVALQLQCASTDGALNFVGVTSDPSAPSEGTIWYNTTDNQFKGYNGTSVVILG